jgi:hypothetical protein
MVEEGMVNEVELRHAFIWTCENCGRDHFERAIELDHEAVRESLKREVANVGKVLDKAGLSHGGSFVMEPTHVACSFCGATYRTGR